MSNRNPNWLELKITLAEISTLAEEINKEIFLLQAALAKTDPWKQKEDNADALVCIHCNAITPKKFKDHENIYVMHIKECIWRQSFEAVADVMEDHTQRI